MVGWIGSLREYQLLSPRLFRQAAQSRIITSAHKINQGSIPDLSKPEGDSDFDFMPVDDPETVMPRIVVPAMMPTTRLSMRTRETLGHEGVLKPTASMLCHVRENEARAWSRAGTSGGKDGTGVRHLRTQASG
jgi:hypothetical protein